MKNYDFSNESQIKELAYILKKELSDKGLSVKHGDILNILSHAAGAKNWNAYSSHLKNNTQSLSTVDYDATQDLLNKESAGGIVVFLFQHHFTATTHDYISNRNEAFDFLKGLARALVFLRNNIGKPFSQQTIYDSMSLSSMISLSKSKDLPSTITDYISDYLMSLPDYSVSFNAEQQSQNTKDAHNLLRSQFVSLNKNRERTSYTDLHEAMRSGTSMDIVFIIRSAIQNKNPVWQAKIESLLITISEIMVYLRNNYNIAITPESFCQNLHLKNIMAFHFQLKYSLPKHLSLRIAQYVSSLHGYHDGELEQEDAQLDHLFKQKPISLAVGHLTGMGDAYANNITY